MKYTIKQIEEAELRAAVFEWGRMVHDDDKGTVGDRGIITQYYTAIGQASLLPIDDNGHAQYRETAKTSWCGVFAAYCGLRVGDFLDPHKCVPVTLNPEIAQRIFISTYRLAFNKWPVAPEAVVACEGGRVLWTNRKPSNAKIEDFISPGRLACVKTRDHYGDYRDKVGGHVIRFAGMPDENGDFETLEGNGRGKFPDDTYGEGVVRGVRNVRTLRRIYLLGPQHYDFLFPDP